jgi:hypothetical protein
MPSLVFPNCVELRVHWTMNGVDAYNVMHGVVASGFVANQTVTDTLDAALKTRVTSMGLQPLLATTTSMVSVNLRDLRTPNAAEFVGTTAALVGTGAGNPLPNEVALCVTLRTALAGRSYRGRVYLGGFIVGENSATGQIVTALNTAAANTVFGWAAAMSTSAITMAILSRPRPAGPLGVPPAYAGALTPVISAVARDTLWDSQRRRKR